MNDDVDNSEELICPQCADRNVSTRWEIQRFPYGIENVQTELAALVPLRTCAACGLEYTDYAAEESRHDAVCRHVGVMTPSEVTQIRQKYALSRAEFGRITGLGEASLSRWEKGALLQSTAHDRFLFLMTFKDNLQRLRQYRQAAEKSQSVIADRQTRPQLRVLHPTEMEVATASTFELRVALCTL